VSVHWVLRTLVEDVPYPDHTPRKDSSEYRKVHHKLTIALDEPCWICGVRNSTLADPEQNPAGATYLETHHHFLEWALANAVDTSKLLADFPDMGAADDPHLREWLDSEGQMLVLCNVHHRSPGTGVHMVTYPIFEAQRWLKPDFPRPGNPHT
jgi:hypothetical protein